MSENRQEQRRQLREKWEALLQDWQASGLSAAEWCRRTSVSPHQFVYWKKRLVVEPREKITPISFLEISDESISAGIEIVCRDISIRPSKEFDAPTLLKCLQVLRNF